MNKIAHTFVLTEEQFLASLIRGATGLGHLPGSVESHRFSYELVANGIVLTSLDIQSPPVDGVASPPPAPVGRVPRAAPVGPVDTPSEQRVEALKEALAQVCERAPSVTTIRNWTEDQLEKAARWSQRAARAMRANKEVPKRPDFIVIPKPRGRAASANGAAEEPGSDAVGAMEVTE